MLFSSKTLLLVIAFTILPVAALSDQFMVTALAPGIMSPAGFYNFYETFDSQTPGTILMGTFTTDFGGSNYVGTYSGGLRWFAADKYGELGELEFTPRPLCRTMDIRSTLLPRMANPAPITLGCGYPRWIAATWCKSTATTHSFILSSQTSSTGSLGTVPT